MITFQCTGCGHQYNIPEEYAGKKVRCKQCGKISFVPIPDTDTSDTILTEPCISGNHKPVRLECLMCKHTFSISPAHLQPYVPCPRCSCNVEVPNVMNFPCTKCGKELLVLNNMKEKGYQCPDCGTWNKVPDTTKTEDPVSPESSSLPCDNSHDRTGINPAEMTNEKTSHTPKKVHFTCPTCSNNLEADEDQAGRTAPCVYCGNPLIIPNQKQLDYAENQLKEMKLERSTNILGVCFLIVVVIGYIAIKSLFFSGLSSDEKMLIQLARDIPKKDYAGGIKESTDRFERKLKEVTVSESVKQQGYEVIDCANKLQSYLAYKADNTGSIDKPFILGGMIGEAKDNLWEAINKLEAVAKNSE